MAIDRAQTSTPNSTGIRAREQATASRRHLREIDRYALVPRLRRAAQSG